MARKPEYPRRMHCIQGSDAHRLSREGAPRDTDLGVGDRATEVLLPERSFAALEGPLHLRGFRPHSAVSSRVDAHAVRRRSGGARARADASCSPSTSRSAAAAAGTAHSSKIRRLREYEWRHPLRRRQRHPEPARRRRAAPEEAARGLRDAITRSVVPKLDVTVDIELSGGKPVLIVTVPKGMNTPDATDAGQVFVRQESETVVALRDEIVQLVREAVGEGDLITLSLPPASKAWTSPRPVCWMRPTKAAIATIVAPMRATEGEEPAESEAVETVAPERRAPRGRRSPPASPRSGATDMKPRVEMSPSSSR